MHRSSHYQQQQSIHVEQKYFSCSWYQLRLSLSQRNSFIKLHCVSINRELSIIFVIFRPLLASKNYTLTGAYWNLALFVCNFFLFIFLFSIQNHRLSWSNCCFSLDVVLCFSALCCLLFSKNTVDKRTVFQLSTFMIDPIVDRHFLKNPHFLQAIGKPLNNFILHLLRAH